MAESKDRTKIIFHKGTHTIGGTLVEVAFRDSRIFFDLGGIFSKDLKEGSLDEILSKDLAGFVPGLYDPLAFKDKRDKTDYAFKNQAAFISHVHLDHSSLVNFTNPKLKVFTSKDSLKLLKGLSVEGDFVFPFSKNQVKSDGNLRKIHGLSYNETINIGHIKVRLIPVDHDAYGACGIYIETPTAKIAYSGDIRSHGFNKKFTESFIDQVRNPDLLITEGVSFSFGELYHDDGAILSEKDLVKDFVKTLLINKNRQISFNLYPANLDRIRKIYLRTRNIRKLVLTSYQAFVVKKVLDLDLPYYRINEKTYGLDPKFEVPLDLLLEDEGSFLFQMDVKRYDLVESLKSGGLYIHSDAEPLGDYDPAYKKFIEKLSRNNIEFLQIKSPGHGSTRNLTRIIKEINPKKLAPIHSFHPERVYYNRKRLLKPHDGDQILF